MAASDIIVFNHGSIIGLLPASDEARGWIAEHISDDAQWFGRQLIVEPRYVDDILDGMVADGLTIG